MNALTRAISSGTVVFLGAIAFFPEKISAQSIVPSDDGTQTIVTTDGRQLNIQGGRYSEDGSNLFHSFETFGLTEGEIANFISHPNIENILGRVTGGEASVINGLIQVTGGNSNLFLMNPAGMVFGSNASLNVPADFTATTATGIGFGNHSFDAFGENNWGRLVGLPTDFQFATLHPGAIVNAGHLAVSAGHNLGLFAGTIANTGTLKAPGGNITIAAVPGENLLRLSAVGNVLELDVLPESATSLSSSFSPLNLPELLTGGNVSEATNIAVNPDGTIALSGSQIAPQPGDAIVSGELGNGERGTGNGEIPTIQILGNRVALLGATVDASGINGGGNIFIGGDFQGSGTLPNADRLFVDRHTHIFADALQQGNGGRVILWADDTTQFFGNISARGAALSTSNILAGDLSISPSPRPVPSSSSSSPSSSNGGFVEVSGGQFLDFQGTVDTSAPQGSLGTLLLDPTNITIVEAGAETNDLTQVDAFADPDVGNDGETTLDVAALNDAMANVILQATNDIVFNAEMNLVNPQVGLTAEAGNNIDVNANLTTNGGDITLTADADNVGGGSLDLTNVTITTNGGNFTGTGRGSAEFQHGMTINGSTIDVGGGNLLLRGIGRAGGDFNYGINLENGSTIAATGDGTLTLEGTGGEGVTSNYGIRIDGNSQVRSEDGAISLMGVGNGTGNNNYGILLFNRAIVATTGTGNIAFTGSSNGGGLFDDGIRVESNSQVRSNRGNIIFSGMGGVGTEENNGITVNFGAVVSSVDGDITFTGTSEGTNRANHGINIATGGAVETTGEGNITFTGTGGGNVEFNHGIFIIEGGRIATANGAIDLRGTGGEGIDENRGIYIRGTDSIVTSADGDITLDGIGIGTGFGNHGIELAEGGEVAATGSGTISATGQGSAGTDFNHGISLTVGSRLSSIDADITLSGTGATVGIENHGISLTDNNSIEVGGTGTLNLVGNSNNESSGIFADSGTIDTGGQEIQLTSTSNVDIAGEITSDGGNIGIDAPGNDITLGNLNAAGDIDGGNIVLNGQNIQTGDLRTEASENAGDIEIRSSGTIDTTGGILNAAGGINGGSVTIAAPGDIATGAITFLAPGFEGDSGNIGITSRNGNIDTRSGALISASAKGRGGNIALNANGRIFANNLNASSVTGTGGAIALMAGNGITASGTIETNRNNITLSAPVTLAGDLSVSAAGGNITFGGTVDGSSHLAIAANRVTLGGNLGRSVPLESLTLSGHSTLSPGASITTLGDLTTENLTSARDLELTSREEDILAGFLNATGDVTLQGDDITVRTIDTQSDTNRGGDVRVNATGFFRATDTFRDRNGITASISTGGGRIAIAHGGNGETPFIVGDASTNGTAGAIARGNTGEAAILPDRPYLYTHSQDGGGIQFISIDAPPGSEEMTPPVVEEATVPDREPEIDSESEIDTEMEIEPEGSLDNSPQTSDDTPQDRSNNPTSEPGNDPNFDSGEETTPTSPPTQDEPSEPTSDPVIPETPPETPVEDETNRPPSNLPMEPPAPDLSDTGNPQDPIENPTIQNPDVVNESNSQPEPDPNEQLAFLIGDLIGAETTIARDSETGDLDLKWNVLDIDRDLTLSVPTNFDNLAPQIDEFFESQFEEEAGENLDSDDAEITAETIRKTLANIEIETGTKGAIVYALTSPPAPLAETFQLPQNQLTLVLVVPEGPPILRTVSLEPYELETTIGQFVEEIQRVYRPRSTYLRPAQQLYQWLIAPLESELESLNINTLIFAMDAGLRQIPLAALHDGEQFLIERYSLGSIPSMSLTDTRYQSLENTQVLAMGASEFPHSGSNPLPAVSSELSTIVGNETPGLWPGRSFLNDDFTRETLIEQRRENAFGIVHLVTHASFDPADRNKIYIELWNDRLSLDDMRSLRWYDDRPVELLVLSACQTAVGDPNTELGFAGLAVRSGVKSAIASLWVVNDTATLALMSQFYETLHEAPIKAEALRQAQLAMLRGEVRIENGEMVGNELRIPLAHPSNGSSNADFSHPYYWSAFTTIGSPW
ncbi:MAG: CHAT domain-containing protein [Cyanobacteriota bacterium]|nr:CHAT domain-containing protein [Cyanobacteriota bacterium]